jgi:hypothetical protein
MHRLAHLEAAGDVDQRIDLLESREDLCRRLGHGRGRGHVDLQQEVLRVVEPREGVDQILHAVVEQGHAGALVEKMLHDGAAERAGGAGHHDVADGVGFGHGSAPCSGRHGNAGVTEGSVRLASLTLPFAPEKRHE